MGKNQRYKNEESFQTLWQLVGVWQIDNEEVSEVNGSLKKLGYSLQTKMSLCEKLFYFFGQENECYELEGGYFHVKPEKDKLLETCIDQKYHDKDPKKNLEIIAYWLFYVKNNKNKKYQKKVFEIFLPTYLQFLNANYLYEINTEIVSNQSQSITTSESRKIYKKVIFEFA
ncbi:unnamed protein product [Rhizophagus irregularis]|nr:unnamed protein product [Rhizophagus irregularis]